MRARFAVPLQLRRAILLLLSVMFLYEQAEAQHGGGGGGHSGGGHSSGHFGSSRSSGGHTGNAASGRFGWLHIGFGHRTVHSGISGSTGNVELAGHVQLGLRSLTAMRAEPLVPKSRVAPTLFWLPAVSPPHFTANAVPPPSFPHRHRFFQSHVSSFRSSGCFFNGVTQVCFFEPLFPFFCFSGGFDSFFGFGFASNGIDDLNSLGTVQHGLNASLAAGTPELEISPENSPNRTETTADNAADQVREMGVFILVLKNGTLHGVTDYWLADGYIEYVERDGGRSHIPVEALDLERTVAANSPRGLPFVLRSPRLDAR